MTLAPLLDRLREMAFAIHEGAWRPFGEELPMVAAVASEARTAQLAIIVDDESHYGVEDWRQLLFAGSALRHQLRADGPSAFGAPVVLAVVDDAGVRRLRGLAEDLAREYMLFSRVDLNIVPRSALGDRSRLEDALAPLLPRCRTMLGQEISKGEVDKFWQMLRQEVTKAANSLPEIFGASRQIAADDAQRALIADDTQQEQLPAPRPIADVSVHNFRSFADASVKLAPSTVISGSNGSGKTSLLEALEVAWAGTSQRKPPDVDAAEYARHLPTDGEGDFSIDVGNRHVEAVSSRPAASLGRNVLTFDALTAVVHASPADRYSALLQATGLEVPDLKRRTGAFLDSAKAAADDALSRAGLAPLPRRDSHGERHLFTELRRATTSGLPASHGIVGAERALAEAARGAYVPRPWMSEEAATSRLKRVDDLVTQVTAGVSDVQFAPPLEQAIAEIEKLVHERREVWRRLNSLLAAIDTARPIDTLRPVLPTPDVAPTRPQNVPPGLAARWLAHANALSDAAEQFGADAANLADAKWRARLQDYADTLRKAASEVPAAKLRELAAPTPAPAPPPVPAPSPPSVGPSLFLDAGFTREVEPIAVEQPLRVLLEEVNKHGRALAELARSLRVHPAAKFAEHADQVLEAVCRYELARNLRREGPILNASESLIKTLLHDRLAPVVRELVGAIVRFEWYFKPLQMPPSGRKLVFGGLATTQQDLDARLVLNAAEGTALGIAWFLALHMLQPPERRAVLVLDDPVSVFDAPNLGGFISTLRAFVRLTRPDQVIITTHDDVTASLLVEELAPVEGWPSAVALLRCERGDDDRSIVRELPTVAAVSSLKDEIERLGLQRISSTA